MRQSQSSSPTKEKERSPASDDDDNDDASSTVVVAAAVVVPSPSSKSSTSTPARRWLSSFYRSDPRWLVHRYFCTVSSQRPHPQQQQKQKQKRNPPQKAAASSSAASSAAAAAAAAADVFTVWRPTSADAIRRMMSGEATGKGLEIKGKSAKAGKLSGYVPFLQIHNDAHKSKVRTIPQGGRVRIFYSSQQARDAVLQELEPFQDHMLNAVHSAKRIFKKSFCSVGSDLGAGVDVAVSTLQTSGSELARVGAAAASSTQSGLRDTTTRLSGAAGAAVVSSTKSGLQDTRELLSGAGKHAGSAVSSLGKAMRVDAVLKPTKKGISGVKKQAGSVASSIGSTCSTGADSVVTNLKGSVERMSLTGQGVSSSLRARITGSNKPDKTETEWALKRLLWDMDDPSIKPLDWYAPNKLFGIELPDRLLWQAFVVDRDISRPEGSEHYTARPSQPAFQDMNFIAIYKTRKNQTKSKKRKDGEPRVVLWHTCGAGEDPMDPRNLIMAYEENGRVLPVVSDFDCFTMGTRGLQYESPLPQEQTELLQWCISETEIVLKKQQDSCSSNSSWTACWLEVLMRNAAKGFHPEIPRFGFGDGTSYSIIESAVLWLEQNGAVRHGSECFNYYFPQELDDEFLIVSDSLDGKVPWRYVGIEELQQFLMKKIDEGFTFPLNPKWVLCDDGWKEIYDRLMASDKPNVQDSLNVWFPPGSGARENIESIAARHPEGFVFENLEGAPAMTGTEAMDLATLELDQFLALRRAKVKLRTILVFKLVLQSVREQRADREKHGVPTLPEEDDVNDDS